ncbi:MAG: DNA polymerase III subunit gamma/tau [Chloroflexota bacterium]|nr:DNA polymerase III subunit gamma/tau [Chloroflexota bacterium]
MSKVLYRKWRPRKLDQLVGQNSISQTLRRAVSSGRVAHAYLFCGPRGTGKTSTARILAMAVNCRNPQDGEPDNSCDICTAILEGRALDLIEIDAASNRGIDDIRNLSDKVRFTPSEGSFKVYIIDEVHMLTTPAFNALLKTLEEPPEHAIFVLATTEVHKIPLTIISRCQRFDFRRIPQDLMQKKLLELCESEEVDVSEQALALISRRSSGSLRDAENLLEQAIVSYNSSVTEENIRDMTGLQDDQTAILLITHVINNDMAQALTKLNNLSADGADLAELHRSMIEYLRCLLLIKTGAGGVEGYSEQTVTDIENVASSTSLSRLINTLKIFAAVDMRRDNSSPLPLELAFIQSSETDQLNQPQQETIVTNLPKSSSNQNSSQIDLPKSTANQSKETIATTVKVPPNQIPPSKPIKPDTDQQEPPNQSDHNQANELDSKWNDIVRELRLTGNRFKLGALLRGCKDREAANGILTISFPYISHVERVKEELGDPITRKQVEDILEGIMDKPYKIEVVLSGESASSAPEKLSDTSPLVRAARSKGAQVIGEREDEL